MRVVLDRASPRRSFVIFGACLVAASSLAAHSDTTEQIVGGSISKLVVSVAIALGPFTGWWLAIADGAFPQALQLLVPATAACLAPMIGWTRRRRWWLLALTGCFWLLAGFCFTVAMWV